MIDLNTKWWHRVMRPGRRNLLICLCLATTIVAVYSPVCHFGFVSYDDQVYVTTNAHVQSGLTLRGLVWAFTTIHASNWHPLTWLSHMLVWQLWGGLAGAHHLVNVLLHVANALLLFGVLSRITASAWRSALVAGLFALHPLHVESVAWVSERKDVLSTCFWLLSMWAYVRYVERPSGWRYLSALGLYALGLMAKPMVVTLPFVLLLLDYWPLGRSPWGKSAAKEHVSTPPSQLIEEKLPFLALGATSSVLTYWAQRSSGAVESLVMVPMRMRIGNALLSYVRYIGKTFWPVRLAAFYPLHAGVPMAAVAIAGIGLIGITAAVMWRARHGPWFFTGWFWYLGTLVPVIGLVQAGPQSMADRYTYVPSIGLFIMLCWSVPSRAMERPIVRVITCVAVGAALAVCMALSRIQVGYWKDSDVLFRHALDVTRDNWMAHFVVGTALMEQRKFPEAITHLEDAVRIEPRFVTARNSLGVAFLNAGGLQDANALFEQTLELDPNSADAHYNLGIILLQENKLPDAIRHFEEAARINPNSADFQFKLGLALKRAGRVNEAISHYEEALKIAPTNANIRINLGSAMLQAGMVPDAIAQFERALQIAPDSPVGHYNLGNALLKAGRTDEAMKRYESALRLKPDFTEAAQQLARLRGTP
jgi:tetratricopeptide (TPR) repeat protein